MSSIWAKVYLDTVCFILPDMTTPSWCREKVMVYYYTPTASCNGSHPSPGNNLPEHGRAVRKNAGRSKNGRVEFNHLDIHQGSPLLPSFCALSRSLHSSLCCPRPLSRHLFNLTSVYPVPALHLHLQSTPF